MAIWRTIPTQNQSSITLRNWAVIELPDKTRHLIGYCIENCEGRVSSEIESFDISTLTGTTCTSRIYKLIGEPGLNGDAQYVWNAWKAGYQIMDFEEITDAVWVAHLSSTTVAEVDVDSGSIISPGRDSSNSRLSNS